MRLKWHNVHTKFCENHLVQKLKGGGHLDIMVISCVPPHFKKENWLKYFISLSIMR
jgi:hypothetical protein